MITITTMNLRKHQVRINSDVNSVGTVQNASMVGVKLVGLLWKKSSIARLACNKRKNDAPNSVLNLKAAIK